MSIESTSELAPELAVPRRFVHSSNAESYDAPAGLVGDAVAAVALAPPLSDLFFLSDLLFLSVKRCRSFAAFAFSVDAFSNTSRRSPLDDLRRGGATGMAGPVAAALPADVLRNVLESAVVLTWW